MSLNPKLSTTDRTERNCSSLDFPQKKALTSKLKKNKKIINFFFSLSPSPQTTNQLIESSSLSLSNSNLTTGCGPSTQDSLKKWSCLGCTYLNWPRAQRCVQCATKRETEMNTINEQIKSLTIRGSDPDLACNIKTSPFGSTNNLASSKMNLGAGARISPVDNRFTLIKWYCTVNKNNKKIFSFFLKNNLIFSFVFDFFSRVHTKIGQKILNVLCAVIQKRQKIIQLILIQQILLIVHQIL